MDKGTNNVISLNAGIKELNRSKHFNKLAKESVLVLTMLETLSSDDMLDVKTYCLVNDIIDYNIYDDALMERYDVIQNKMIDLKESKGEQE